MTNSEFWLGVLASLIANLILIVLTLVLGWCVYLRRIGRLRLWGIKVKGTARVYDILMSAREDQPHHYRPSGAEAQAAWLIQRFLSEFLNKRVLHITVRDPVLSKRSNPEDIAATSAIFLGGPKWNGNVSQELSMLGERLPIDFVRDADGSYAIVNRLHDGDTYRIHNRESDPGTYTDYGLIIRYRVGSAVRIMFLGLGGQGTLAAVRCAIDPALVRALQECLGKKDLDKDFFALMKVDVNNFTGKGIEFIWVSPLIHPPEMKQRLPLTKEPSEKMLGSS